MSWAEPPPEVADVPKCCVLAPAGAFVAVLLAPAMAPEADAPCEAAVSELVVAIGGVLCIGMESGPPPFKLPSWFRRASWLFRLAVVK